MATERERRVQEKIIRVVRQHEGYVYKNAQNMYTEKGRPDLTACVPATLGALEKMFGKDAEIGVFVGLEVKRDKDGSYGSTDAQEIVGKQIKKAKGLWFVVDDPAIVEALMVRLKGGDKDAVQ